MNAKQLRNLVVRPVLRYLDPEIPYSETAVELLMMTAAHESNLGEYIAQVGGPALGIYQMEPSSHLDAYQNYLESGTRVSMLEKVKSLCSEYNLAEMLFPLSEELSWNLAYATAMARVHYYRDPQALPSGGLSHEQTIRELSHYAKRVWNTEAGKAHADDYYHAYMRRCTGAR